MNNIAIILIGLALNCFIGCFVLILIIFIQLGEFLDKLDEIKIIRRK